MKILITSGGTKIPIDTVRSITNMSHGTLGSRMAEEFLKAGHDVLFFRAEGSKSPFTKTIDLINQDYCPGEFEEWYRTRKPFWDHYGEFSYKTFEDYQSELENIIKQHKPDMIILAAAVSDYGVENPMQGKIRTKGDLSIPLKPLPKIISNVREWAGDKAIIVGFKLLVDVKEEELIASAKDSLTKNKLDYVCANDLRSILNGNHMLFLIDKEDMIELPHTYLTSTLLHWTEHHQCVKT